MMEVWRCLVMIREGLGKLLALKIVLQLSGGDACNFIISLRTLSEEALRTTTVRVRISRHIDKLGVGNLPARTNRLGHEKPRTAN